MAFRSRRNGLASLTIDRGWPAADTGVNVGAAAGRVYSRHSDRCGELTDYTDKIKTRHELVAIVKQAKAEGRRVIFANGCFDVLHGGHISYLEDAAAQGDVLIVAVNSDGSMRALKKGEDRPYYRQEHRMEILAAMGMVDYVVLFEEPDVGPLLDALRPHVHAKGTDYTRDTVPERQTALALGIEIYIAGEPKENASREIIRRIRREGDEA